MSSAVTSVVRLPVATRRGVSRTSPSFSSLGSTTQASPERRFHPRELAFIQRIWTSSSPNSRALSATHSASRRKSSEPPLGEW